MNNLEDKLTTLVQKCVENDTIKMVALAINKYSDKPDDTDLNVVFTDSGIKDMWRKELAFGEFKKLRHLDFIEGGFRFIANEGDINNHIKHLQVVKTVSVMTRDSKLNKVRKFKTFLGIKIPYTEEVYDTNDGLDEANNVLADNTNLDLHKFNDEKSVSVKLISYYIQTVINNKSILVVIDKDTYNEFISSYKEIKDIDLNETLDDIIKKVG